jgi:hypothetical protein
MKVPHKEKSNLATTTIGFGIVLIVLGVGGYFATDRVSIRALIPAVFGALLTLFGALARDDKKRKMGHKNLLVTRPYSRESEVPSHALAIGCQPRIDAANVTMKQAVETTDPRLADVGGAA